MLRILQRSIRIKRPGSVVNLRTYSSSSEVENGKSDEPKMESGGGFAKAFMKYTSISDPLPETESFSKLLRHSKFVDIGDPSGKIVVGVIFHVVKDDLYIDFGGKFHCVCPRPSKNARAYVKGASVKLRLKELELSTKFLGMDKDLTLLEADADLLGLIDRRISGPEK